MFKNIDDASNYFKSLGLSEERLQLDGMVTTGGYIKSSLFAGGDLDMVLMYKEGESGLYMFFLLEYDEDSGCYHTRFSGISEDRKLVENGLKEFFDRVATLEKQKYNAEMNELLGKL